MIEDSPKNDIGFDALGLTIAQKHRSAECFCSRATLDDLLSDEVMAPVLRSVGYEPDEFREMMTEMVWNPVSLTEPPRDIVVIGASRGGIEAIREIVAALPPNLQSTLLIVLHISPTHVSLFPAHPFQSRPTSGRARKKWHAH